MSTDKPLRSLVLALAAAALAAGAVCAHIIILKDGFVLQGTLRQAKDYSVAEHILIESRKGHFSLDDGARQITFPANLAADVSAETVAQKYEDIKNGGRIGHQADPPFHGVLHVDRAKPWTAKWQREITIRMAHDQEVTLTQRLTQLTPSCARVEALHFPWVAYYHTTEFRPDDVRDLLSHRPKLNNKERKDKTGQRFLVYRFLAQAGWYDEAAKELSGILSDFPGEKQHVRELRKGLQGLQALRLYDDIQRGYHAGQHRQVQQQLADFPAADADAKTGAGLRSLRTKYDTANKDLQLANGLLKDLPKMLTAGAERALLKEAATAILAEMNLDDFLPDSRPDKLKIQRLEPLLSLAKQAERDRKKGRQPLYSPSQLLAVAVSGWLLGKESAEAKPAPALRLWQARSFVLKYQKTADESLREQMRDHSEKPDGVGVDEMAQLIAMLPPPEPEEYTGTDATALQTGALAGGGNLTYVVQLPPEYTPGRAYPVLFALHQLDEKPAEMLERLGGWAGQYGYILVAPRWGKVLAGAYGYTAAEQAAVTGVLSDLRRRYQVDSNRVFLLGFGQGAAMAYDVGLSHPDLFAGVIPVSGRPAKFAWRYWANGQFLPFYVVDGSQALAVTTDNNRQFEHWLPNGYPALHVRYKGRGVEWFAGEVPQVFAWMEGKRRARGVAPPGKYAEFVTMRETDNHFYWLSADGIAERNLNDANDWDSRTSPAWLRGRVGTANEVMLSTHGLKQVTVWLGQEMLIDFDKPLVVLVDGTQRLKRRVQPSLGTLLEDFYARGDRQRLFLAKISVERP
jgi:pimeloyl-ACP methyl ester carboxylesterase